MFQIRGKKTTKIGGQMTKTFQSTGTRTNKGLFGKENSEKLTRNCVNNH